MLSAVYSRLIGERVREPCLAASSLVLYAHAIDQRSQRIAFTGAGLFASV